jgi:hypothetical protein
MMTVLLERTERENRRLRDVLRELLFISGQLVQSDIATPGGRSVWKELQEARTKAVELLMDDDA